MLKSGEELFKSHGLLWQVKINEEQDLEWLDGVPLCPTENCRSPLQHKEGGYWCSNCEKQYPCPKGYQVTHEEVERKWQGYKLRNHPVHSLDLPPTKVGDMAEDENYWIKARIGEKNGKKMAVVYFGEKTSDAQNSKDYVQAFLDFEDEQLRFDKANKNPMKLLAKLTAEFPESTTTVHEKPADAEQ